MKFLGNYLAGEIVPYGDVFADDANTPTDCTSPSARLAKPAETVNLTTPAKIGSKTGFFGGFIDSAGFSAGSYRIYQVGIVSGHTAAQNYTFNIVASRNLSTPNTLRYGGVFHDDDNTPADPSSPSYAIYDSAGVEKATGTPSKLDGKTGSYGDAVDISGLSDGAHLLYMTGTVSAHAVAAAFVFQKFTADTTAPGVASATVNAKIDGVTARFTLSAVPSDADLNEIKIEYAEKGTGTWSRSAAFPSNAVGQTVDITVVRGARYAAHVVSIDNSGNEQIHQALEFEPRDPTDGSWTEISESVDPGWSEV